jgi:hypothetical protein
MKNTKNIVDRNGKLVKVGTKVKIISVPEWLLSKVPADESKRLSSMVGKVFQVYEIDEWGGVWVEKWFNEDNDILNSHISLNSTEMEVIDC